MSASKKPIILFFLGLCGCLFSVQAQEKQPVDYANPYMGNISHLLVPTYPTIHLPNSMLRVCPERADYTGDVLSGLPDSQFAKRADDGERQNLVGLCQSRIRTGGWPVLADKGMSNWEN
jgi:hypothetical protein